MKTKLNKILTVITAVTFAAALTLNIQASLSDPFAGMSDEALAQTTSGVTSETTGGAITCVFKPGDFIGDCLIMGVTNIIAGYQFWYETGTCQEHCTPGGTHCCYDLDSEEP